MSRSRTIACIGLLTAALVSSAGCNYDCTVYVSYPSDNHYDPNAGQNVYDKHFVKNITVDAGDADAAQTKAAVAADLPDLGNYPTGSFYTAVCKEQGKDKSEVQPVVYTFPSETLKGVRAIYWRPVGPGPLTLVSLAPGLGQERRVVPSAVSSQWTFAVMGGIDVTKATAGFAPGFFGGVRAMRALNPNLVFYGEFAAGITHFSGEDGFPGESDLMLKPALGFMIPLQNKPFSLVVSVGFPKIFFSGGDHEGGQSFSGGISIPIQSPR